MSETTTTRPKLYNRILYPLLEFIRAASFSGILLMVVTIIAIAWANSPWAESYAKVWSTPFTIALGDYGLTKATILWVNDGLMAIFFFVVGLEIKRETMVGELSSIKGAAFPVMAALGGMIVPAGVFVLLNLGDEGLSGWGIPMATDIAFALGILTLLGNRAPLSLKLFLIAYAIVDDIGAVLVIALFYTSEVNFLSLWIGFLLFGLLLIGNALRMRNIWVYILIGVIMWVAFLKSGVHATIAGILLAITIPGRSKISEEEFVSSTDEVLEELRISQQAEMSDPDTNPTDEDYQGAVYTIESNCEEALSPMHRLEHALHPWVAFAIMPIFALANAGIAIDANLVENLNAALPMGIILGLVLGKPIGILMFSWIASATGIAAKPTSFNWLQLIGVGLLGGVGFTMSIFIANLAFADSPMLPLSKLAILCASLVAGIIAYIILRYAGSRSPNRTDTV
ncbi:Na(+)/H(+) antiporter NhaA [Pontibacter korlensis]|uniref:Na(+)/H(+) antiporter NhaA n=1 Tax=Pontibacter korlensis TaxID=400092 RepID=A0A0E3ZHQ0_9BACT|nr:Na+/H+ antiporter NhaA [Pontibacter korlensis]AKD04603.1 Na(+)/H(+) antiporter NhaA [Pontibacter korlensis]